MINTKETKKEFITELLNKNIHKILDLGCGEMLLPKAFLKKEIPAFVKGIDIKEPSEVPEGAVFVKGNFFKEEFEKDYDLIIASLILHFTKREYTLELIKKIQNSTAKSGYNFLILMSNRDPLSKYNMDKFFPSLGEISEIYKDWKIIKVLEDETEPEQHTLSQENSHTHNLIFVIFQKQQVY